MKDVCPQISFSSSATFYHHHHHLCHYPARLPAGACAISLVLHYLLYSSQLSQGCSFSPHFTNEELKPRVAKRCSGLRPHRLYMAKLGPESASWDYSSKASPLTLFSSTAIFMKTIRKLRVTGLWWSFARGGNRAGGDVS